MGSFQVALAIKSPPVSAGDIRDVGSIPGSGRSLRGGHGNLLRYPCLENPMDRGAWWATVLRVTKSQTQLKQLSMHVHARTHTHTHTHTYIYNSVLYRALTFICMYRYSMELCNQFTNGYI